VGEIRGFLPGMSYGARRISICGHAPAAALADVGPGADGVPVIPLPGRFPKTAERGGFALIASGRHELIERSAGLCGAGMGGR